MIALIARRLAWTVAMLIVVSFITFLIFTVMPSTDPAHLLAGPHADPGIIEAIRQRLGLDKPVYVQYWRFFDHVFLHFDFGSSYANQNNVRAEIFSRIPATMGIVLGAAVIWLAVGVTVGIVSAVRRGTVLDRAAMGGALVAISAPTYWLGLVALYLFSSDIGTIHLFRGAGSYPQSGANLFTDPLGIAPTLILPWLVTAAGLAAIYARFMRSNLLEVMGEDYIRTARMKGLSERRVILRHGVRAAITPIVTILALDVGILLGGVILIEEVFNIPGVGQLGITSIQKADLPTIEGVVIMGAFFIILLNLIVDVLYVFIDPRVRT